MKSYSRKRIKDKFSNLKVSRQRKWQLRHPEQARKLEKRYRDSPHGKAYDRKWQANYRRKKVIGAVQKAAR